MGRGQQHALVILFMFSETIINVLIHKQCRCTSTAREVCMYTYTVKKRGSFDQFWSPQLHSKLLQIINGRMYTFTSGCVCSCTIALNGVFCWVGKHKTMYVKGALVYGLSAYVPTLHW